MAVTINGTTGIDGPNASGDTLINGVTVGTGAGDVATNTAVGVDALAVNQTGGTNNTAIGYQALDANTTGDQNTAVGDSALGGNTTAGLNTAVGYQAGLGNTTSGVNTYLGAKAGYTGSTGDGCTFVGYQCGYTTTGTLNTFIGYNSGYFMSSGAKNTIVGPYNGNQNGFDIRTANNYIVLSDGDGYPKAWIGAGNSNDLFRVGTVSTSTTDWMHQISYSQTSRFALGVTNDVSAGNPSGIYVRYPNSANVTNTDYLFYGANSGGLRAGFYNNGGLSNYQANNNNLSDRREKTNFAPAGEYLSKICAIPVQTFNYIDQDLENDPGLTLGVVAQDVQAVAPELVTETNWGTKDSPKMRLAIYQTDLQYALMKCIQEQQVMIQELTAKVAALEAKG